MNKIIGIILSIILSLIIISIAIVSYAVVSSDVTAKPLPNHNPDGTYLKWSYDDYLGWGVDTIIFRMIDAGIIKEE